MYIQASVEGVEMDGGPIDVGPGGEQKDEAGIVQGCLW